MTPTWVTIIVGLSAGVLGSVLATASRGRYERLADLREKLLVRGSELGSLIQAALPKVRDAVSARASESDEEEPPSDDDDDLNSEEPEPQETWSYETRRAYDEAAAAVASADSAMAPLLLLVSEESAAVKAGMHAVHDLAAALSAVNAPTTKRRGVGFIS